MITETATPKTVLGVGGQLPAHDRPVSTYPPEIPMKLRAQYRHLPARKVVIKDDNNQTGRKDLELSGDDVEMDGTIRVRNVEKCTGIESEITKNALKGNLPPKAYPAASPPIPPSRRKRMRFFRSNAPGRTP
jgi:hypothetical protein